MNAWVRRSEVIYTIDVYVSSPSSAPLRAFPSALFLYVLIAAALGTAPLHVCAMHQDEAPAGVGC